MEYEIGIIQEFKPVTARATFFYYDIEDFINDSGITSPGMGIGSNCLFNIDSFKHYGIELELSAQLGDRFRATAAYVYQENEIEDTGYEQGWTYYLPDILPKHKIKLLTRYRVRRDGWLQLSSRWVDKRNTQKDETLGDYITLDLGFEQKFKFQGQECNASLFCSNLTGTVYQEQAGYSMPRQIWGFQLGMKF